MSEHHQRRCENCKLYKTCPANTVLSQCDRIGLENGADIVGCARWVDPASNQIRDTFEYKYHLKRQL